MNFAHQSLELNHQLLLADPSLRQSAFAKTVILIAEYDPEDGAFGLILNQPTGQTVGEMLSGPEFSALAKVPVHVGGPVSKSHLTFGALWSKNGTFGYAARISAEEAAAYAGQENVLVRAFIGYSGWAKGQLEAEIEAKSWHHLSPKPSLIQESHDISLWRKLLSGISPYHSILASVPDEIFAN